MHKFSSTNPFQTDFKRKSSSVFSVTRVEILKRKFPRYKFVKCTMTCISFMYSLWIQYKQKINIFCDYYSRVNVILVWILLLVMMSCWSLVRSCLCFRSGKITTLRRSLLPTISLLYNIFVYGIFRSSTFEIIASSFSFDFQTVSNFQLNRFVQGWNETFSLCIWIDETQNLIGSKALIHQQNLK